MRAKQQDSSGGPQEQFLPAWFEAEFEQSYEHLRDRDQQVVELTRFFSKFMATIVAAMVTATSLNFLKTPTLAAGTLGVVGVLVGEGLLFQLLALRRYFVRVARQLNALRDLGTRSMSAEDRKRFVVQPTSTKYPELFHLTSTHIPAVFLFGLICSGLAGLSVFFLCFEIASAWRIMWIAIAVLGVLLSNGWVTFLALRDFKEPVHESNEHA